MTDLEKKYRPLVIIASIIVPLVVASLFQIKIDGLNLDFLPPIYAGLNGFTAILLVLAVINVKKGKIQRHRNLIRLAILSSLLFLAGYIAYHISSDSTLYGDLNHDGILDTDEKELFGFSRIIYLVILISHILLSIVIIPLVMFTFLKGWANNVESHKKWARKTFPIWLYVAISGVVVYCMISPFY